MQVIRMELYITRPNNNRELRQPFGVIHRAYGPANGILEMEKDPTKIIAYTICMKSGKRFMVLNMGLNYMAADPLTKGLLDDMIPIAQGIAKVKGCELEIECGRMERKMAQVELRKLLRNAPATVFRIRRDGRPIIALPLQENATLGVSTAQA